MKSAPLADELECVDPPVVQHRGVPFRERFVLAARHQHVELAGRWVWVVVVEEDGRVAAPAAFLEQGLRPKR